MMTEEIEIRREDAAKGERYVTEIEGHEAELTFTDFNNKRVTDYTGVPKELGGRGIGIKLVKRAVEDAREDGKQIIPTCWFVRQQIERHDEWQDVLS